MTGASAMMPHHHDFDSPQPLFIQKEIGKIGKIRSSQELSQWRKVARILPRLGQYCQKVSEELICKMRSTLRFIVIQNLANLSNCQSMVSYLHADRPIALRNSS